MLCNSKNVRAVTESFFFVQVDQTFLKVLVKSLVKVAKNGEGMSRRQPISRELSFKFYHTVSEARCLNYANN